MSGQAGSVAVKVNAVPYGPFNVTGNINVTLGKTASSVDVAINGGFGLPASLSVTGGNGNDSIAIGGNGGSGAISGNLSVFTGNGDDVLDFGGGGLAVGGITNVDGGTGNDFANFGGVSGLDLQGHNLRQPGQQLLQRRPHAQFHGVRQHLCDEQRRRVDPNRLLPE